jgi:hypothetical protein
LKITNTLHVGTTTLKILVIGESGAGKTSLALTIEEPILIISAESGLLPLRGKSIDVIDLAIDDEGHTVVKEKRMDRLAEAYRYVVSPEARNKYKWIFIDSLTEISQNLVEKLQVEFPERKDSFVMYGENAKKIRALIKSFRDLPWYNVVFTALSVIEKDENNHRYVGVSMVGAMADKVPAYFDEVFYLHVEKDEESGKTKRMFITEKSDRITAKDRSGTLNKYEPADLGYVYKKIKGELK